MYRPRVLLAADSLQRAANGIARVARLTALALADEARQGRLQAEALVLADGAPVTDLGLPVRTLHGSRARFMLALHRAAARHTHIIYDFPGIARAQPRAWPLAKPHLVWVHGIEVWEDARADRLRAARRADVLVANSAYTRWRMVGLHTGLAHARTCWLATEEDTAPPRAPVDGPPAALIMSRLDAGGGYKGHRELIEAWPRISAAVPGARLLIAGDGPGMPVVRAWAEASEAREQIEILGFVEEGRLDALRNRASVFAMPSRGEGFGLAYIEAMRHGLPVIASVHDAGGEINADQITGYNVDLDRPGMLSQALVRLLSDPALCDKFGAAGETRWREHFTYSGFRTRFLPILQRFLHA